VTEAAAEPQERALRAEIRGTVVVLQALERELQKGEPADRLLQHVDEAKMGLDRIYAMLGVAGRRS
jgi:hypothetical protein